MMPDGAVTSFEMKQFLIGDCGQPRKFFLNADFKKKNGTEAQKMFKYNYIFTNVYRSVKVIDVVKTSKIAKYMVESDSQALNEFNFTVLNMCSGNVISDAVYTANVECGKKMAELNMTIAHENVKADNAFRDLIDEPLLP
jgi:hypothetical protein